MTSASLHRYAVNRGGGLACRLRALGFGVHSHIQWKRFMGSRWRRFPAECCGSQGYLAIGYRARVVDTALLQLQRLPYAQNDQMYYMS